MILCVYLYYNCELSIERLAAGAVGLFLFLSYDRGKNG